MGIKENKTYHLTNGEESSKRITKTNHMGNENIDVRITQVRIKLDNPYKKKERYPQG